MFEFISSKEISQKIKRGVYIYTAVYFNKEEARPLYISRVTLFNNIGEGYTKNTKIYSQPILIPSVLPSPPELTFYKFEDIFWSEISN